MIFLSLQTHFKPNLEYQKVPTLHCQIFCQFLNANHQEFFSVNTGINKEPHAFISTPKVLRLRTLISAGL